MSIHYKFSASATFRTITFNGVSISLSDLKREIMEKEGLKPTESDLTVINAQSGETYSDHNQQISKNSSVKVQRAPLGRRPATSQAYTVKMPVKRELTTEELKRVANLAEVDADEEKKIEAMMNQSTIGYDKFEKRKRYPKPNEGAPAPSYLRCYKCQGQGHYPNQCPMPKVQEKPSARPPTGIPRSSFKPAQATDKGAKLTAEGQYVVTHIDEKAYSEPKIERPPFLPPIKVEEEEDEELPDELTCRLCNDLVQDPHKTQCCQTSYCRECIINRLLESDEQKCPQCKRDLTPMQLTEDKILKMESINFKNRNHYRSKKRRDLLPRPATTNQVARPKVTYGTGYGSVYNSSSGKTEANPTKSSYVVKTESPQVINVPDESKEVEIVKTEPMIKPEMTIPPPNIASIPPPQMPPMPIIPATQTPSGPPPLIPPINPSVPPPGPPPSVPGGQAVSVPPVPPGQLPPPMPPLGVPPPTTTTAATLPKPPALPSAPPPGPPPLMPPLMPPGMPMIPGMPPMIPGMMPPGMPPNMPPMPPGWPGFPGMGYPGMPGVPPPMTHQNGDGRRNFKDRDRSRSHSNRRSRSRDRDRRSRSRERYRRSRSRDRRSRSRDRNRDRRDRRSRSGDRRRDRRRSRSRDRRSSRDRDRSRDRSTRDHEKESRNYSSREDEKRRKSASRSPSSSKQSNPSSSPEKSPSRQRRNSEREQQSVEKEISDSERKSRKSRKRSKEESRRAKKSHKVKTRDRDRRNVEKSRDQSPVDEKTSEVEAPPSAAPESEKEREASPVRKRKRETNSDSEQVNKRRSVGQDPNEETKQTADKTEREIEVEQEQTISSTTGGEKLEKIQEDNQKSPEKLDSSKFDSSKWKPVEKDETGPFEKPVKIDNSQVNQEMDMEMEDELEFSTKSDELEIHTKDDSDLLGNESKLPDLRTVISRSSSLSDVSDNYQIKPKKTLVKRSDSSRKLKKKKKDSISDKHIRHISYDRRSGKEESPGRDRKHRKEKKKSKDKERKSKKSKKERKRSRYSDENSDASPERVHRREKI